MIKIENVDIHGWEAAIRGMRNPMMSHDKSDSYWTHIEDPETLETANYQYFVGDADLTLMQKLSKAGNDHGKFMRFIDVTLDITAPLYWYKEFDTYKVGTVANSYSTMHKIHAKEFAESDFSIEHLREMPYQVLMSLIKVLNIYRVKFLEHGDKNYWWQLIQLLPSSYNQTRTVKLNYAVLKAMYHARKAHKLDEWREFCAWIESLPYAKELILDAG